MLRPVFIGTTSNRPWLRSFLLMLTAIGIPAMTTWADEISTAAGTPFELWDTTQPVPRSAELLPLADVEFYVIKRRVTEFDGYNWLHGVALAWHRGQLFASFGHNVGAENTAGEEANGCISSDGGKTWGRLFRIDRGDQPDVAVSHGVFLSREEQLWAFHGAFRGRLQDVHTRGYVLDEKTGDWRSLGNVADEGFWPMQPPQKMKDGNWIMSGLAVTNGLGGADDPAAVAISRGADLTNWEVVRIPKPKSMDMWGEASLLVDGANLLCISRYRMPIALVATSDDYGSTWTTMRESNLPMAASQPFAGILSTGQRFLIGSCAADNGNRRSPLTIAVSDVGGQVFKRIYRIRDAIHLGPGESVAGAALAYPYAVEHEGKLYIGYSNDGGRGKNRNSAELAVIPIVSLQKE